MASSTVAETTAPISVQPHPNSKTVLADRVRSRCLTWIGPIVLVIGRSVLMVLAQAFTAFVLFIRRGWWSWDAAATWWSVYGTMVDVGCLALMAYYSGREGLRLRDIIGRPRLRWGRDLFLGVGIFFLVFPLFLPVFPAVNWLIYRDLQPHMYPGLLTARHLPLWAVAYSLGVWLLIWSPTEEMTYQGYALPRIEALSHNRWVAVAIVAFWWALQHSFIPFILDWKYVAARFLGFLPSMVVFTLLYLKVRRLPPFFVAHWPMDLIALLYTLKF